MQIQILRRAVSTILIGLLLGGCNQGKKWEIAFCNNNNAPASCYVTLDPDGKKAVKVKDFAEKKTAVLIAGSGKIVVHSVVVKIKDKEVPIAFTPDTGLDAGMHFSITLSADGSACTEIN